MAQTMQSLFGPFCAVMGAGIGMGVGVVVVYLDGGRLEARKPPPSRVWSEGGVVVVIAWWWRVTSLDFAPHGALT
jgi:hypothetical protein